mmetsp:Transcript_25060/g.53416  ORF Transcript_25060/g.53416 Transcript_25060/m.53416 type:complete len:216 (+) Transcript_25060:112-759(+)
MLALLELREDGGGPGVRGLFGRREVFGNDSVLGDEGESLGARHHGGFHGETEGRGEFAAAVAQEDDAGVGSPGGSPPGLHHKVIVRRDADDQVDSLFLELVLGGDETGKVRFGAPGGEGTGNTKDDDLLSGDEFGNVDCVVSLEIGETLREGYRRDLVPDLDFGCHGCFFGGGGGDRCGQGAECRLLETKETVSNRETREKKTETNDCVHGNEIR